MTHEEALSEKARRASLARRSRHRLSNNGHPTTADIQYTPEELAFMQAIQAWKTEKSRQFPTWREVLAIAKAMGYKKVG